jgi:uncharacterized protein (DUF433 family)
MRVEDSGVKVEKRFVVASSTIHQVQTQPRNFGGRVVVGTGIRSTKILEP